MLSNAPTNQEIIEERQKTAVRMRIYIDVVSDLINYLRYYPETLVAFERRLVDAVFHRDQETHQINC